MLAWNWRESNVPPRLFFFKIYKSSSNIIGPRHKVKLLLVNNGTASQIFLAHDSLKYFLEHSTWLIEKVSSLLYNDSQEISTIYGSKLINQFNSQFQISWNFLNLFIITSYKFILQFSYFNMQNIWFLSKKKYFLEKNKSFWLLDS